MQCPDVMTIAELISELRGARDLFDWQCQGASKSIRGFLKTSGINVSFDPVRAVCFSRTNLIFDDAHRDDASRALGLSSGDCEDVLDGANNHLLNEGEACSDIYKQWLRRQLIFAVGLHTRR